MASTNLIRRDYILNKHMQSAWTRAAVEHLDPYTYVLREQRIFELIVTCDPTTQGRYHPWLSKWRRRQWKDLGIRYVNSAAELEEMATALRHFELVRKRLPTERRDIGRYETALELLRAEILLSDVDRKALRDSERRTAQEESTILYEDEDWKLVRLDGRNAAVWWGRGTRWCTAARSGNQFASYARLGDLLVLVTPSGRYQLAKATGEFRDAADAPASLTNTIRGAPSQLRRLLTS